MTGDLTLSHQVQSFLDTIDWDDDHDSLHEKRRQNIINPELIYILPI
jgi:hypothetical protein